MGIDSTPCQLSLITQAPDSGRRNNHRAVFMHGNLVTGLDRVQEIVTEMVHLRGGRLLCWILYSEEHTARGLIPSNDAEFCNGLRFQPVDATHWLNRSAGVSKFNVSLGLSLRRLATAFSLFW